MVTIRNLSKNVDTLNNKYIDSLKIIHKLFKYFTSVISDLKNKRRRRKKRTYTKTLESV